MQLLVDSAPTHVILIQVAGSAVADLHRLTLRDLSPTTIWLLQGAPRKFGHMSTGTFLDLWWHPKSRLGGSSLPAHLGLADPELQRLPDPNLLLGSPRISGSGIQYDIELLSGSLPSHTGACVLFLGPGQPVD